MQKEKQKVTKNKMPLEKITLDNGMKVIVDPKHIGKSAIHLVITAGALHDVVPETAHVTEHLQGARLHEDCFPLDYAEFNAITTPYKTYYFFESFLPKHLDEAARKLRMVFEDPYVDVLEREKTAVFNELKGKINPFSDLTQRVEEILFPKYYEKKPKLRKRLESVKDISSQTIYDFCKAHYHPANSILVISGEGPADLNKLIEWFKTLEKTGTPTKAVEISEEPEIKERIEIKEHIRQDSNAGIAIAYRAPSFPYSETIKERVAKIILKNYLGSTHGPVFKKLRNENGLVYQFGVACNEMGESDCFVLHAVTGFPELSHKIEQEWIKCLKETAEKGVDDKTLETNRNQVQMNLINNKLGFDLTGLMDEDEFGVSRLDVQKAVDTLTSEDISKTAQYFVNKPYVISITLPKEKS